MNSEIKFNYIITIHNKQDLIEDVLLSVLLCCRKNSHVYAVLDGCTDNTESIIDSLIVKFKNVPITKVYTNDLHELLTINAGLRAASHNGNGFNIILQDDVVLADFLLEEKIERLYSQVQFNLGYLSLRLGANIDRSILDNDSHIPLTDYIESVYGHGLPEATPLLPDYFVKRDIPIKSPVCIPFHVINKVGILEEKLAPYAHDDTDYAIRCIEAGYENAVYALKFHSEVKWGGTRINPHPEIAAIQLRNIRFIKNKHEIMIGKIIAAPKNQMPDASFSNASESEISDSLRNFELNRKSLLNPIKHKASIISRVRNKYKTIFKR